MQFGYIGGLTEAISFCSSLLSTFCCQIIFKGLKVSAPNLIASFLEISIIPSFKLVVKFLLIPLCLIRILKISLVVFASARSSAGQLLNSMPGSVISVL